MLQTRTGGIRRPSPKCSLALMSNEPGTAPPMSAQWPFGLGEGDQLSPWKIGRMMRTSLKCVPPSIRVVDDEDVARVDVALEAFDHRLGREVQRADVDGDVADPCITVLPSASHRQFEKSRQ